MKHTVLLIIALLAYTNFFAQNCNLNDEARRHIVRAKVFIEAAENEEDYSDVFIEYEKAFKYAPDCPGICYNLAHFAEVLCKIDIKNCDVAISYYKKYLELNPNAEDRKEVQAKLLYGIEAKKRKI